jgi:hypothetical protein
LEADNSGKENMWEEQIVSCSTFECKNNDGGECTIDPIKCPYLKDDSGERGTHNESRKETAR